MKMHVPAVYDVYLCTPVYENVPNCKLRDRSSRSKIKAGLVLEEDKLGEEVDVNCTAHC